MSKKSGSKSYEGGEWQGEQLVEETAEGESQPSNILTLINLDAKRTDFLGVDGEDLDDNCGVDKERCNKLDNFNEDLTNSPDFLRINLGGNGVYSEGETGSSCEVIIGTFGGT